MTEGKSVEYHHIKGVQVFLLQLIFQPTKQKFLLFQCMGLEELSPTSTKPEEMSKLSSRWSVCLYVTASICHLVPGALTSIAFTAGMGIKASHHPLSVIFISVWFPGSVQEETGLEQRTKADFWAMKS